MLRTRNHELCEGPLPPSHGESRRDSHEDFNISLFNDARSRCCEVNPFYLFSLILCRVHFNSHCSLHHDTPCASSPPFPASRPSLCIIPSFPHHDPPRASSPRCAPLHFASCIIVSFCITASLHHSASSHHSASLHHSIIASFCITAS